MAYPVDVTPVPSFSTDFAPPDALHLADDEGATSIGQQINERRALSENPEALRLARAL